MRFHDDAGRMPRRCVRVRTTLSVKLIEGRKQGNAYRGGETENEKEQKTRKYERETTGNSESEFSIVSVDTRMLDVRKQNTTER